MMTDLEIADALRKTGGNVVAAAKLVLASTKAPKPVLRPLVGTWLGTTYFTGKFVNVKYMTDGLDQNEKPVRVRTTGKMPVQLKFDPTGREKIHLTDANSAAWESDEFYPKNYFIAYPIKLKPGTIPETAFVNSIVDRLQSLIEVDHDSIKDAFKRRGITYTPWTVTPEPYKPIEQQVKPRQKADPVKIQTFQGDLGILSR